MATFSDLLRSFGLSSSSSAQTTIPTGFEPLDADQLQRMKAGFETEGDSGDDEETIVESYPEPDSGDIPPDDEVQ